MYCACAVRIREAENKSSVRYEVIAGIISIINQRFSRGAGGGGVGVEKRKVGEEGEKEEDYYVAILKYLESLRM